MNAHAQRLRGARLLAGLLLIGAAAPAAAAAPPLEVSTESFHVVFESDAPRIRSIELRASSPLAASLPPLTLESSGPEPLLGRVFALDDDASAPRLDGLRYSAVREDRADVVAVRYRARLEQPDCELEQVFEVPRTGHVLRQRYTLSGPGAPVLLRALRAELVLAPGPALAGAPDAAGWSGLSERVRAVVSDDGGTRELEGPESLAAEPGRWLGLRNRYWALLLQDERGTAQLDSERLRLSSAGAASAAARIYLGPVEHTALSAADPSLAGLLFTNQWAPIRLLARGLGVVLDSLLLFTGVAVGGAIVLLSLFVRAACLPLVWLAERWQRDVDRARARIEPALADVRKRYRGEERSTKVFELYREHGVHPLHGLKSLLGVAIQVPIFFAAYHLLDEHVALAGASMWWIADLSLPDRVATLPFTLPLLGDGLNLLPLLMSAATVLASRLHDDGALPPNLVRSRRRGLYAMAAAFLLLFYTFPAGMVLYWTTNNVLSLARAVVQRLRPSREPRGLEIRDAPAR